MTKEKRIMVTVNVPNALESIGRNAERIKRIHRNQIMSTTVSQRNISKMEGYLEIIQRNLQLIELSLRLTGESIYKYKHERYFDFFVDGLDYFITSMNSSIESNKKFI